MSACPRKPNLMRGSIGWHTAENVNVHPSATKHSEQQKTKRPGSFPGLFFAPEN